MNSIDSVGIGRLALLAALFCAGPAVGQEAAAAAPASGIAPTPLAPMIETPVLKVPALAPAPAAHRANPLGGAPIASSALAARRGGDERIFSENKLKGVVADNKASNLTTGMNVISEGAFAGSSGLSTVIQNSGNNVLIQNATIVNVQVK